MQQRLHYPLIILLFALCAFVEPAQCQFSDAGGEFVPAYGAKMAIDYAANAQDSALVESMYMDGETVMSTSLEPRDSSDIFRVYGWGPQAGVDDGRTPFTAPEYLWFDPKVDGYWSIKESNTIYSTQASWYNLGAQEVALHDLSRPTGFPPAINPDPTMYPGYEGVKRGLNFRDIYGAQILDGAGVGLVGDFDGDGRSDIVEITREDSILTSFSGGDGEFYSVFFTPWSGYGTRLGAWVVSDVNRDGRDDLQHIWGGGDYINTWTSRGDGTYQIKSFRPWSGYNTSLGIWTQGDVNGDGRGDLLHLVSGEYINTWISRGDGTYEIKSFQPWSGYGTKLGQWGTADVNGDGRDDLLHIWGGDYINTWISRGDGTYLIKSFQPWPGYGASLGGWATADVNGDGRVDLQHIWGGDYINTWISRGDGTYQIKSFRPKPGYKTNLGLWTQGDVNGDGRGDLLHIWGGDFINTWISRGDGTYQIKSFRPWPGYVTAIGEFHIADYNGDGLDDILHLFGGYYPYYYLWTSNGDGTYYL
jgi:hypothetical protein